MCLFADVADCTEQLAVIVQSNEGNVGEILLIDAVLAPASVCKLEVSVAPNGIFGDYIVDVQEFLLNIFLHILIV